LRLLQDGGGYNFRTNRKFGVIIDMDNTFLINTAFELLKHYPWFGVVGTVISSASAIAAVTPTPKAGSNLAKAYKVIDILALNVGKAKDK